jgi:two-component system cell cycle sensor histidine kinase/response regulator CckA
MTTPLDDLASALQCTLFPVQVLIVDDDRDARGAMQRVLEREGYSVVVAGDGAEALRLLEGTHVPVDLIVSDVQMPGLLGDALVLQVRQSWPDLPVLFVSGEPRFANLPEITGGRSRFLLKPFGPAELLEGVMGVLAPQRSYEEMQASRVLPSEARDPLPRQRDPSVASAPSG